MDEKFNALCVRSVSYREADKIITLFTLEKGLVDCAVYGARRAGSKLNFAAEVFCFAEYLLSEKNDRRSVKEANEIDGFYGVRGDIVRFYAASAVAEFIRLFVMPGVPQYLTFSAAVAALKGIEKGDPLLSLTGFLINALDDLGFGMELSCCKACDKEIKERAFFDFPSSAVYCLSCAPQGATEIRFSTFSVLSHLSSIPVEDLKNSDLSTYSPAFDDERAKKSAIKMLDFYIEEKTGYAVKTLKELLEII